MFAEAYFVQWQNAAPSGGPPKPVRKTAYKNADSVLQVAVSLIMLNTGLHVAPKKVKNSNAPQMTVEEYIQNTRRVVDAAEVPEECLVSYYDDVKGQEISLHPLPRVAFARLPVQPDIEGWLIVLPGPKVRRRCWAVLALQRLYLFSDASEVEPWDAIDLKDKRVAPVCSDRAARDHFASAIGGTRCGCVPGVSRAARRRRTLLPPDAEDRAFEVSCCPSSGVDTSSPHTGLLTRSRRRLALVAESQDLMEKWVNLITSGPY